jgi:hypothetical protein
VAQVDSDSSRGELLEQLCATLCAAVAGAGTGAMLTVPAIPKGSGNLVPGCISTAAETDVTSRRWMEPVLAALDQRSVASKDSTHQKEVQALQQR